jgi:hypothetical protein
MVTQCVSACMLEARRVYRRARKLMLCYRQRLAHEAVRQSGCSVVVHWPRHPNEDGHRNVRVLPPRLQAGHDNSGPRKQRQRAMDTRREGA